MASYKLQHALELEKYWNESKYTDAWNIDKQEWIKEKEQRTEIIAIDNINTFLYDGKILIDNPNGPHRWKSAHYKVAGIKTRPYVTVSGKKYYLDELLRIGDFRVCMATTTKTEEWKHYCIGLQTHFAIE